MVLAVPVAFVPAGGNIATAILTALLMGLLAGIAWMVYVMSRENQLTLATLTDSRRAILYGAVGLLVLVIGGYDHLRSTGGGTLLAIVLFGVAVAAIWRVWMEAHSL
jgi:hypothetical protein